MTKRPGPRIPYTLLALDVVGALLVAAGIVNRVGEQPSNDGIAYIVAGFLLMTPLVIHIVKRMGK